MGSLIKEFLPSSIVAPNRNITKVEIGNVGQQPQRRPGQVEQHRAAVQSTRLSIRAVGAVDSVAPQRPHRRSLRSPELHRRPEPQYH